MIKDMLLRAKKIDLIIIALLLCFMAISTIVIYSATHNTTKFAGLHVNNLVMFSAMFVPMLILAMLDYRGIVRHLSVILYVIGILLLIFVMFKGMNINGSQRWINLHFMQFQPSELAKIFVILLLAKMLENRKGEYLRLFQDILPMIVVMGIPCLMVMNQPDLGTSIVFVCILIGMLWIGKIRIKHGLIGLFGIVGIIGSITMLYFVDVPLFNKIVKPHQLHRIQTFINPASDPDQSYHVLNSIKAVSSGELMGEGFLHGKMVQSGYIPYDYADSIYVVIGEEFGFVGSAVLLLLYFFLIYRMIRIAMASEDVAGSYLIIGVISMFTLQIFENIAMHTGLMPLTGIALPFVSYGGSSLMTNMLSMGLVLSVSVHQSKPFHFGEE
ncbi:rod shape determining protein RodA [Paenibacillus sp. yr247]|uniref:FtsW/RodA/SpoVE family cell cycle protein n=1 Tax=Paenibacillus sp. yr247 TaxID=1761880 RepID=UPI00088EAAC0|nr:FtsW/RodA/SpoVE family cell cycle protein [Paenibacillus sp. yr247]SDO12103.1 rod shape determining protein RodA [Paenibacillus sp. yr247]